MSFGLSRTLESSFDDIKVLVLIREKGLDFGLGPVVFRNKPSKDHIDGLLILSAPGLYFKTAIAYL